MAGFPAALYLADVAQAGGAWNAGGPSRGGPGFAVAGAMAMAVGWAALAGWLPQIAGPDVLDVGVFDERFLAVFDCDVTAHIPQ
jgi:hypothetical protein